MYGDVSIKLYYCDPHQPTEHEKKKQSSDDDHNNKSKRPIHQRVEIYLNYRLHPRNLSFLVHYEVY